MSLLFENGRIRSFWKENPEPEAVGVTRGKIHATGSLAEVEKRLPRVDRRIDLAGRLLIPGFNDAHTHFGEYAQTATSLNLSVCESLEEILDTVAEAVQGRKRGELIFGGGWDNNRWEPHEEPHRRDLDRVAPDNPVVLHCRDGHAVWLNTLALTKAGITRGTASPSGGRIVKEMDSKEPTGFLSEEARRLVSSLEPQLTTDGLASAIEHLLPRLHRLGITSLHDFSGGPSLSAFLLLHAQDRLPLRVYKIIPPTMREEALGLGLRSQFGNEAFRLGGQKLFADGTLGSQTASLIEPYIGRYDYHGTQILHEEELKTLVEEAARAGVSTFIHCIGDKANRTAIKVFQEEFEAGRKIGIRHRIEHAQLIHPDDIETFGRIGLIASMQPIQLPDDIPLADRYWGDRSRFAYPFRSLLNAGARLAFGSDLFGWGIPPERFSPLRGIYAAVTRRGWDGKPEGGWYESERLTVDEALEAYTLGSAFAAGEEALKGSIAPGKLADLVILSNDIVRCQPQDILTTRVEMTVWGGEIVYEA